MKGYPQYSRYRCQICDKYIKNGEDYIRDLNGEYAHRDCLSHTSDIVDFLGGTEGVMEDYDEFGGDAGNIK